MSEVYKWLGKTPLAAEVHKLFREAYAFELRLRGWTFREIGRECGVGPMMGKYLVERHRRRLLFSGPRTLNRRNLAAKYAHAVLGLLATRNRA